MPINVNITKAKVITKDRLRADRTPLLEAQDVLFMKAQESGADTTAIVAEKQRLRDITKKADSCKTADELKALSDDTSVYDPNNLPSSRFVPPEE